MLDEEYSHNRKAWEWNNLLLSCPIDMSESASVDLAGRQTHKTGIGIYPTLEPGLDVQ